MRPLSEHPPGAPPPDTARPKTRPWYVPSVGAIIFLIVVPGVCLAINVPGFVVSQCRLKRSEGKTLLKQLYVAEMAYREDHGYFTSDLVALGFQVEGEAHRYLVGFAAPGPADLRDADRRPDGYDPERRLSSHRQVSFVAPFRQDRTPLTSSDLPRDAVASRDAFVAAAVGDVDGDATLDAWSVDQTGELREIVNDCAD